MFILTASPWQMFLVQVLNFQNWKVVFHRHLVITQLPALSFTIPNGTSLFFAVTIRCIQSFTPRLLDQWITFNTVSQKVLLDSVSLKNEAQLLLLLLFQQVSAVNFSRDPQCSELAFLFINQDIGLIEKAIAISINLHLSLNIHHLYFPLFHSNLVNDGQLSKI